MLTRPMLTVFCLLSLCSSSAFAQQPKLDDNNQRRRQATDLTFPDEPDYVMHEPLPVYTVREIAWDYIDPPLPPRKIQLHDIISILVDEKSELTLRSGFDRQRTNSIKAQLKDWIRFGEKGRLENAAANQPTIDASLQDRMQNSGRVTDQEGISYRIAATVVNVLPNGNLVLEAHKVIRTDSDLWRFSLTGVIASRNVTRAMTAKSENIAGLNIVKDRTGKVHSSTKARWGTRLYDLLWPF